MPIDTDRPLATAFVGTTFVVLLLVSVATVSAAEGQTATVNPTTGASQFIAGYSGNVTVGTTFTIIDALWNVPAVTCQPKLGGAQQVTTMIQAKAAQGFFFGISRGGFGLFTTRDLAKFGSSITFEVCDFDLNAIQNAAYLNQIVMQDANGRIMAQTSGLSGGGAIFIVTWARST